MMAPRSVKAWGSYFTFYLLVKALGRNAVESRETRIE
jgi:hypothetical protein